MNEREEIERLVEAFGDSRDACHTIEYDRLMSAIDRVLNEHSAAFAAIKGWAALLEIEKERVAERDARIAALEKALTDRQNRIVWMEDALLATEKPHE